MSEDQFKPLRLMNGLYLQLHAYMLRVAMPYGTLNSRADADAGAISPDKYDRGYGHFTTRQNIQYNWIKLEDAPDILPTSPRSKCTRSRPAAIASATSPPTSMPAPPPTRSSIRAPGPNCCASGRPSTRNSAILPRKFKIAVIASPRPIARRCACTISASRWSATTRAKSAASVLCRRRHGPHPDDRAADPRIRAADR
jgi:sulfite reductase (NADPH) hemoprotein beta-component